MGGQRKSQLPVGGASILERQLAVLRLVADPVFQVTSESRPADAGIPAVTDEFPDHGALGGIYTAIVRSPHERTLVVACDMPFLDERFLQHMAGIAADLVIPRSARGYEPLCAIYSRACAVPIHERLTRGKLEAARLPEGVKVVEVSAETLAAYDPDGLLLVNVNTPHDYERAKQVLEGRSKTSRDRIMDELGP
jgi:molybdopterin-guanine dinucleotide biosynthesis protein A